ncbi:MAG: Protein fmp52, mitochondrial [Bathelium mastoideum]|nr:MAG: Protein fmp52, mitochondrial [Bathelium mastoideum]
MNAVLVGSTGLVGSHILTTLLSQPSISTVHAYSRKPLSPTDPASKLTPITESDNSKWPTLFPANASIFLSALGTTRGAAGGFANQRKIDHDLNIELAQRAHDAGVSTYVLISSAGANASSRMPYMRMKGEIDAAVSAMGFENVVVLRPGLLVGDRKERRLAEGMLQKVAAGLGRIHEGWLKDTWAQDVDVIARAAVRAGELCVQGKKPEGVGKVWLVEQADIIRLGRTEWKD